MTEPLTGGLLLGAGMDQHPFEQIYPASGWVEHDPEEIWRATQDVIAQALQQSKLRAADLAAIGHELGVPGPQEVAHS